jgi:hypothetical protein
VCEVTWQLGACCIPIVFEIVLPLRPLIRRERAEAVKVEVDRHKKAIDLRQLTGVAPVGLGTA